jgi:hypothetical protein
VQDSVSNTGGHAVETVCSPRVTSRSGELTAGTRTQHNIIMIVSLTLAESHRIGLLLSFEFGWPPPSLQVLQAVQGAVSSDNDNSAKLRAAPLSGRD